MVSTAVTREVHLSKGSASPGPITKINRFRSDSVHRAGLSPKVSSDDANARTSREAEQLRPEGDEVDGDAFMTLIRAAVALNRSSVR
jgi:hypothetical protein